MIYHVYYRANFNEDNPAESADVGNIKKDIIYTVVTGLDKINWDGKDRATCLTKVQVGFLKNDGSMDLDKDYSKCAGANKPVGFRNN